MKTYRNEHAVILVDGGVHLIQQVWTGVPSSENFRDGSIASLTLAKRHHIKRWLVDLRTLRLFNPIDLQWFAKSWLPEAVHDLPQNGRVAILLNEYNQFGKLGADLLLRASTNQNPALSSRYFLSDQEARDWLLRAPEA